jgi:hypothetical protein
MRPPSLILSRYASDQSGAELVPRPATFAEHAHAGARLSALLGAVVDLVGTSERSGEITNIGAGSLRDRGFDTAQTNSCFNDAYVKRTLRIISLNEGFVLLFQTRELGYDEILRARRNRGDFSPETWASICYRPMRRGCALSEREVTLTILFAARLILRRRRSSRKSTPPAVMKGDESRKRFMR